MNNYQSDLINELEGISNLFKKAQSIQNKMDCYTPSDSYERKVKVPEFPFDANFSIEHEEDDALQEAERIYNDSFEYKKPTKEEPKLKKTEFTPEEKNKHEKWGFCQWAGLGIAGFFALGSFSACDDGMALTTILLIALSGLCLFFFSKFRVKKLEEVLKQREAIDLAAFEDTKTKLEKEFEQNMKNYEEKLIEHNENLNEFLEEYKVWREIYLKHLEEEKEIAKKLEADRLAEIEKIERQELTPVLTELARINTVPNNYLNVLDKIIMLIKSGRAEDLKEAINLYEEIQYRERQLQLQREQEANRRYEAQREREAQKRCDYCDLYWDCRMKYSDSAYNCTAFRPTKR